MTLNTMILALVSVAITIAGHLNEPANQSAPAAPSNYLEWSNADVGLVFEPGSTIVANDSGLQLTGSGSGIGGFSDSFHFAFQPVVGDVSLIVRVDALEADDGMAKTGIMLREGLEEDARNVLLSTAEQNELSLQWRLTPGRHTDSVSRANVATSGSGTLSQRWLYLERRGNRIMAAHSADGVAWHFFESINIDLASELLLGVVVSSRSPANLALARFSELHLSVATDDVVIPANAEGLQSSPVVFAAFEPSVENFPNPERGWHGSSDSSGYSEISARGFTLVRRYVRLDDYRHSPLPDSLLADLAHELAALRDHGLKIILRFSYNFGPQPDAPLSSVLEHIRQLKPVIREHSDVIAVLQAGFIGHWGEWHSTTNNLLTLDNRRAIVDALLDMLPQSRMLQIRYPSLARDLYPSPVGVANAFTGVDAARVGQVNDCFLSNAEDGGTYEGPADESYVETVTKFTVMGGETCPLGGLNARNDGSNAVVEMQRYHWDYIGWGYWRPAIEKWIAQGYMEEISRRLGYRFVLQEVAAQTVATPGGLYSLNLKLHNDGFGKLYNPRPIHVVLRPREGGASVNLHAHSDARLVLPLASESTTVAISVPIPIDIVTGEYDVHIALPDAANVLAGDPRYSIRFANEGVWDSVTGTNSLGITLSITSN